MGLEFLRSNGARRVRDYSPQPILLDGDDEADDEQDEKKDMGYEIPGDEWQPITAGEAHDFADWSLKPRRFVDGKDEGRTVAWLQSPVEGYPVPVRLAQVGALVMRDVGGELRRDFEIVERIVTLMVDLFPWHEIESFAIALQENGFRLLPTPKPTAGWSYDFESMRKATADRSRDEMGQLERLALSRESEEPTIIDGLLTSRRGEFPYKDKPVVGVVKRHSRNYLHEQGWRAFYRLRPGQRTPAFCKGAKFFDVVTWYLRLDGAQGELPNWGVVRVEIPRYFFETAVNKDWEYINRLSRLIVRYRCRDQNYGRAPVSLHPIQRAEESLGALFTANNVIINRFYRLTNL